MMSEHQDDRGWWLWHASTLPWRLWPLIRDRHATVSEVLQRLFGDDEAVKFALASNLAYYTDDPDTMPFLAFAIPQASYLLGGGHYVRGGSQVLSDRLVAIVREAGGEVEAGRDVRDILLEGNRARGVRHHARGADDPSARILRRSCSVMPPRRARRYAARAGARDVRCALPGPTTVDLIVDDLAWAQPPSREFGVRRYSTAILPDWMRRSRHSRQAGTFLREDPGIRMPPYGFVAYDQIDSGLNRNGPYLVSIVGVDRLENWSDSDADAKRTRKEHWMDRIIADLDGHFPGIAGAVVQRECRPPRRFIIISTLPAARSTAFRRNPRVHAVAGTAIGGSLSGVRIHRRRWFHRGHPRRNWAARAAMKLNMERACMPRSGSRDH